MAVHLRHREPRQVFRRGGLIKAATVASLLVGAIASVPGGSSSAAYGEAAQASPLTLAAAPAEGLTPSQIHSAYSLPIRGARGQTIAVVTPYDDPYLEADLMAFTRRFGLASCDVANRCLRKLNQRGVAAPLPGPDPTGGTWNTEHSLSAEVVRGVCQSCSILVVEADSEAKANLSAAVDAAARAGASVVVTTFVPAENYGDAQFGALYSHPGTVVVAATGDGGYSGEANFPAALPDAIAVGGTRLALYTNGHYASETAWSSSTSGCSLYQRAPAWQSTKASSVGCGDKRAVADIAAVADPGALVHVSGAGVPGGPWYGIGGTSLSAPIIAGALGLAGGGGGFAAKRLYERARTNPGAFRDIRVGSNSPTCRGAAICSARAGFDGPTGLGTPNGLGAFLPVGELLDPQRPGVRVSVPAGGIRLNRAWDAHLRLLNRNRFTLSASLVIGSRRALFAGGGNRTVLFGTGRQTLRAGRSRRLTVVIPRRYRASLTRLRSVPAFLDLTLRDANGGRAATTVRTELYAPR